MVDNYGICMYMYFCLTSCAGSEGGTHALVFVLTTVAVAHSVAEHARHEEAVGGRTGDDVIRC